MNFNRKITYQVPTDTPDGYGGSTTTFADGITTNAALMPTVGSRILEDGQTVINQQYIFNVRFRRDFTPDKTTIIKLMHTGELYTIQSVVEMRDNRSFLEIRATKKQ